MSKPKTILHLIYEHLDKKFPLGFIKKRFLSEMEKSLSQKGVIIGTQTIEDRLRIPPSLSGILSHSLIESVLEITGYEILKSEKIAA